MGNFNSRLNKIEEGIHNTCHKEMSKHAHSEGQIMEVSDGRRLSGCCNRPKAEIIKYVGEERNNSASAIFEEISAENFQNW